jgi:antitoxin (DNA-binding transcriptional repressor) of toxin-antitoxin stability system
LNRQTAKVLDRIKAGESLEICEHGRPVARLSPPGPATGATLLDSLITQGRAVPAANSGPIPPTPASDEATESISLRSTLAEMRDDERY